MVKRTDDLASDFCTGTINCKINILKYISRKTQATLIPLMAQKLKDSGRGIQNIAMPEDCSVPQN